MSKPLVSILCICYNQEEYIRETLDGFIMQETDFPFEVIVHDDASTDSTSKIVKEYAKKYPDKIVPWIEKENQFSKNNSGFVTEMYRRAKGKYVIPCEGDDYWTDKEKLQLQVDFLEKHPDYNICFHPAKIIYESGDQPDGQLPSKDFGTNFTLAKLLKGNYIFTNTALYRKQKYDVLPDGVLPFDWYMHLFHARNGNIGYIDRVMSVYRRHEGGIWWESGTNINSIWHKHGLAHFKMYVDTLKLFDGNKAANKILNEHITEAFTHIIEADKQFDSLLLAQIVKIYPEIASRYIINQSDKLESLSQASSELDKTSEELKFVKAKLAQDEKKLQLISRSRVWKLRNKVAKQVKNSK